jgi:hypothetical protein
MNRMETSSTQPSPPQVCGGEGEEIFVRPGYAPRQDHRFRQIA